MLIPEVKSKPTHCRRGHEYAPENTHINKRGARVCRACSKISGEKWRSANPERLREIRRATKMRLADKIRAYEKTPEQRARRSAMKRRLRSNPIWRAAERDRINAWRESLPEEIKQRYRDNVNQWRRANRERVRELNRIRRARQNAAIGAEYLTAEKLRARRDLYGGRCFYCGSEDADSMDHRIPVTRGGTEFPSNQVPCCKSCNSRKGTRLEREWVRAA